MKKKGLIISGFIFALVTFFQYELIVASIISLVAWCVLLVTHPGMIATRWQSAIVEYWLASVVWIATAVWFSKSIVSSIKHRRRLGEHRTVWALSSLPPPQRRSVLALCVVAYVAVAAPFLTPVDPNAQGNLVTTRILPPLSTGYVRESVEKMTDAHDLNAKSTFSTAKQHLLNRTVSISSNRDILLSVASDTTLRIVRESKIVFLFGTDDNGRDVFSRVIAGTRVSLGIGICAALGALLIGGGVGVAAGMYHGAVDTILMRLTDVFLAIPGLFLVIGVLAFVGESVPTIVVVLSLSGWMGIARVVRGEVISLREREFVLAAKLLQVSAWRIMTRHLIPNIRPVLLTSVVLQFANAVLGEAALGFLGLGIQPPTATWGNMMGEATAYLSSAWWMGVFPGLLLAIVMILAHSIGSRSDDWAAPMELSNDSV